MAPYDIFKIVSGMGGFAETNGLENYSLQNYAGLSGKTGDLLDLM